GAQAAATRRARSRYKSRGKGRPHEARAGHPGPRRHRAAHRARYEARDGHLGLRACARLRRGNRARQVRGSAPRPTRHRSVPGQRRMSDAVLSIKGIETYYGRIQALHGVTIEVGEGEIVALIGGNGAGKTTTLRTISGLLRPARGTITVRGNDLAAIT